MDYYILDVRQMLIEIRCILSSFAGTKNNEIKLPSDAITQRPEQEIAAKFKRYKMTPSEVALMTDQERDFWKSIQGVPRNSALCTLKGRMDLRQEKEGWGFRPGTTQKQIDSVLNLIPHDILT